ncbi:MAG: flagellin [Pseudomonadota bacterium]|nr:flagellin [Pseudomonadota bacterium]
MTLSVNNNSSALAALAALNRTSADLAATNAQVSSGHKVGASKDNASIYAVAQSQRADIQALSAVTDGLNRAQSISDVGISAGQSVSDLLNTLKTKVLSATDPGLDASSRAALNTDFKSLLQRISQTIQAASFDGSNLLDGSLSSGLGFIASADASASITLTGLNLSLGGSTITVPANADISTVTNASAVLSLVASSISNVNSAVANLGAQSDQIVAHNSFVGKLADSLTVGVGNLVDADIPAESARLSALQVQQQLGAQSLSIANQGPSVLLSLFKG